MRYVIAVHSVLAVAVLKIVPAVGLEAAGRADAKIIDEINKESLAALKPAGGSTR